MNDSETPDTASVDHSRIPSSVLRAAVLFAADRQWAAEAAAASPATPGPGPAGSAGGTSGREADAPHSSDAPPAPDALPETEAVRDFLAAAWDLEDSDPDPGADEGIRRRIDSVLAGISRARAVLAAEPARTLTVVKYDTGRLAVLEEWGVASVSGKAVWPPTSQTLIHRFGTWNATLEAAGLGIQARGRARGQVKFDAQGYRSTMLAFVADCTRAGTGATYAEYTRWAKERKGSVPSPAAVRKYYGTWKYALMDGE